MAERTGTKRPREESDQLSVKRRKVHHVLHHVQQQPAHIEPAPQNPVFAQGQLMRSISAALTMVGFDSAKPTAIEMFRAAVEEYMLKFLHYTRTSMTASRRTRPTAMDFASALALMPNTSRAELLRPQLQLPIPEQLSCPTIEDPNPEPAAPPDLSLLLDPLLTPSNRTPAYVPSHFPRLPSLHTWKHTAVYPQRESDARSLREAATAEGVLAEQALRKLAAAAKLGAVRADKRKESALSGPGKKVEARSSGGRARDTEVDSEAMFAEMLKEVAGGEGQDDADQMDLGDGERLHRVESMPEGVVVNWDTAGWRQGQRRRLRL